MVAGKIKKLVTRKTEGAEGVVVALVLIVVAVALCIIFRNQIAGIINNALDKTSGEVNNLFSW